MTEKPMCYPKGWKRKYESLKTYTHLDVNCCHQHKLKYFLNNFKKKKTILNYGILWKECIGALELIRGFIFNYQI